MTRIEQVEEAYKRAIALVRADLAFLPENAVAVTPLVLGLVDRILPADWNQMAWPYSNLTATGAEVLKLRSEQ